MRKFDCKICLKECKACCCSIAPIEEDIYLKNIDKIVSQPSKVVTDQGCDPEDKQIKSFVFPITDNGKCCFLDEDCKCVIYEERPSICKSFGDESHETLRCFWQDKDGVKRTRQERRYLQRKYDKTFDKLKEGKA